MSHERLAMTMAEVDDLDQPALDAFVARRAPAVLGALSRDEAAGRLGLLARVAPRVVPTMAGLYVFGRAPQLFFPEWGVVCMASAGASILDPVAARADLDGGLAAVLEAALAFVRSRSNAVGAVLAVVRAGIAVSVLPDARFAEAERVVVVGLSPAPRSDLAALFFRKGAPRLAAALEFATELRARAQDAVQATRA